MRAVNIFDKVASIALMVLSISMPLLGALGQNRCRPLIADDIISLKCNISSDESTDSFCGLRMQLNDDFRGYFLMDEARIFRENLQVRAISPDTMLLLHPMLDSTRRSCDFVSNYPMKRHKGFRVHIPEGMFRIYPETEEVDTIDIDEEILEQVAVAGAWHKSGREWTGAGMFSVIDDDSLDGQIPSSKYSNYSYGYWSLLYPLLESLGLKGNLAVEGRKIGIDCNPPYLNDNGRTLLRLQNEKGWSLLSHSMECLGEIDNNWMVDGINSTKALQILRDAPSSNMLARTVSIYDMQTRRQYWPNSDHSEWVETPQRYIKPYIGNYDTKKNVMYNPDFDVDWHWGETKRRAESFGLDYVGFVTHNSTSSHSLVAEITKIFPNGFSDIGGVSVNYPPMLSSCIRSGLEGQSMDGYNGNSTDNTFNIGHFQRFCSQIDEAAENGGWIIFNLHAYREVWLNRLPGALVSEGGSYPDEWVIPMKGMDSADDPLTPPAHLGITDWSEWYPCPGTRLDMMWRLLKYAKAKGLLNVTCAEGFDIMGNKVCSGYFNNGHRFGMDRNSGLLDTHTVYPHYVRSVTDEVSYCCPLILEERTVELDRLYAERLHGRFLIHDGTIAWSCADPSGVYLEVWDMAGHKVAFSPSNMIDLGIHHSVWLVCAMHSGCILGSIKVIR